MRIVLTYGVILAAMCLSLDAYAADAYPADGERFIPDCAGEVAIAHVRVARVESDGALILPDGRALVPEGIRLPLTDKRVSGQVLAALRDMALAGPINFTTGIPGKDRYGRTRVQGFSRLWLQTALLEQGRRGSRSRPIAANARPTCMRRKRAPVRERPAFGHCRITGFERRRRWPAQPAASSLWKAK